MQKNYAAGRLDYTTDYKVAYKDADVIFIGVDPEQPDGSANLYIFPCKANSETIERIVLW